jgi:polygalacturonase
VTSKKNRTNFPVSLEHSRAGARTSGISRRKTLRLTAAALALSVVAWPTWATWYPSAPHLSIGSRTVNVRNAGARGDGVHDDTAAFQAAINSLPSSGGTVTVPAGRYRINALKSVNLRSHMRLKMDSGAQLVAIPNNRTRSYVVKAWRVNNVEIVGGEIVGERARHAGSTGEWGMGLDIRASSNVSVRNLKTSDCWGDGVYIGAIGRAGHATPSTDITLNHVTSTGNRRQGMSIGPVQRVYVVNSAFLNTHGTMPQSGIDIEPQTQGPSRDIRIESTTMAGNGGNGLVMHGNVAGVVVKSSKIEKNNGFGVLGIQLADAWIAENVITQNGLDGVAMTSTTRRVKITSNTINYNSTRWFKANHRSIYMLTRSPRDLQIDSSTWSMTVSSNTLSPRP